MPCPGALTLLLPKLELKNLDSWEVECQLLDIEDPNIRTNAPNCHTGHQTLVALTPGLPIVAEPFIEP